MSSIPLFQGLSDQELAALSQYGVEKQYSPGQRLAGDSEEANSLFLICEGRVKLTKSSYSGKEHTIKVFEAGDMVGTFSLFTGIPFPADAVALDECRTLVFPRRQMEQAARRIPSLMVNLFYALALCMNDCVRKVESLTLKEIPQRLAAFILLECEKEGCGDTFTLAYSHRELSKILGATPETLSRVISRFLQDKLLEQNGRRIRILNRSGLESLDEDALVNAAPCGVFP